MMQRRFRRFIFISVFFVIYFWANNTIIVTIRAVAVIMFIETFFTHTE